MESRRGVMGEIARSAWRSAVEALFPFSCLGCGREGSACCAACGANIAPSPARRTLRDGTVVVSLYPYGHPVIRGLLGGYKFSGWTALRPLVADLLSRGLAGVPALLPSGQWTVSPVPLHQRRERARGFNQAKEVAKLLLPYLPAGSAIRDLLIRKRNTAQQSLLERGERRGNVTGAFQTVPPRSSLLSRKAGSRCAGPSPSSPILLVDDVITSGETLLACARALRDAGYSEVRAFTFAHAQQGS